MLRRRWSLVWNGFGRAARRALLLFSACLMLAASARAQETRPDTSLPEPELRLRLPLEIGHGPLLSYAARGAEWVGEGSLSPGFSWGELELSAVVSAAYTNPRIELALGGRASYAVLSLFERTVGIRLAAEATYALRSEKPRVRVGLQPDLAGLLRLGLWGGRDFDKRAYYVLITIGSDITTWGDPIGAIVQAGPMEDSGDAGR